MAGTPEYEAVLARIKDNPTTQASKFWQFPFLPTELQIQIFGDNLPSGPLGSPMLTVHDNTLGEHISFKVIRERGEKLDFRFSLCKVSRQAALDYFRDSLPTENEGLIRFNGKVNIIHIRNFSSTIDRILNTTLPRPGFLDTVQKICVDQRSMNGPSGSAQHETDIITWGRLFSAFKNLRKASLWAKDSFQYQCPKAKKASRWEQWEHRWFGSDVNNDLVDLALRCRLLKWALRKRGEEFKNLEEVSVMAPTRLQLCYNCHLALETRKKQRESDRENRIRVTRRVELRCWGMRP